MNYSVRRSLAALAAALILLLTAACGKADPAEQVKGITAASSDTLRVSGGMMTYYINVTARNYAQQNSRYLETLGLDLTQPLHIQPCYYDKETTWFDYFAGNTLSTVEWMLAFGEQAKASGAVLTQEEEEGIRTVLARADLSQFGEQVTAEDVRAGMELYYLAARQEELARREIRPTEQQVTDWAAANEKRLQLAAYAHYTIAFGEKNPYPDKEAAEALAAEMLAADSTEAFAALIEREFVARELYTAETIAENRGIYRTRGHAYTEGNELDEWLFGGGVKVGDTFRVDGEGEISLYQCLEVPARSEAAAVDVRHILITPDTAGSDAAAFNRAEKALADWKAGPATEESFADLAAANSEDGNASQGGLYTAVTQGVMVDAFNDWCFDPARKPGDTGIVKTSYGYHVMYFVEAGEEWYLAARAMYREEQFDALYKQLIKKYHVQLFPEETAKLDL